MHAQVYYNGIQERVTAKYQRAILYLLRRQIYAYMQAPLASSRKVSKLLHAVEFRQEERLLDQGRECELIISIINN